MYSDFPNALYIYKFQHLFTVINSQIALTPLIHCRVRVKHMYACYSSGLMRACVWSFSVWLEPESCVWRCMDTIQTFAMENPFISTSSIWKVSFTCSQTVYRITLPMWVIIPANLVYFMLVTIFLLANFNQTFFGCAFCVKKLHCLHFCTFSIFKPADKDWNERRIWTWLNGPW